VAERRCIVINLELNDAEMKAMDEVLESYLSDLRMEIADTDRADFRKGLKEKKALLVSVLERVKAGHA
jgi:hypothetical protein